MTAPLAAIDEWPVDNVAAGLVTTSGERHTRGPADKRFGLASVTKPLTTVVTLVAVEEDVVSLDDPAGPPGSTVRHLLAHASGLSPDNPDRSLAQVGARRIYSNAGFETLAAHVSQRAGIPFVDYWHEALMLSNTELRQSPAWGAESTVDDLLSLAEALLDPGLLAAETLALMTTPTFPDLAGVLPGYGRFAPNPWGLGVEIRGTKSPHWTAPSGSPRTFGHFGRAGTFMWIDPDTGLACVILTDRDWGEWAVDRWPAMNEDVLSVYGSSTS